MTFVKIPKISNEASMKLPSQTTDPSKSSWLQFSRDPPNPNNPFKTFACNMVKLLSYSPNLQTIYQHIIRAVSSRSCSAEPCPANHWYLVAYSLTLSVQLGSKFHPFQ